MPPQGTIVDCWGIVTLSGLLTAMKKAMGALRNAAHPMNCPQGGHELSALRT